MDNKNLNFYQTYSTFSGADIRAYIPYQDSNGNAKAAMFAELQTLSYSIHKATKNVYGLGKDNPIGFTQGRRTIAGSMVFYKFHMNAIDVMLREISKPYGTNKIVMLDQLPPFNIIILIGNEYGVRRFVGIYGVKIMTEGLVMSIQDLTSETTCQFIAMDIEPMRELIEGEYEVTSKQVGQLTMSFGGFKLSEVLKNEQGRSLLRNNPITNAKRNL